MSDSPNPGAFRLEAPWLFTPRSEPTILTEHQWPEGSTPFLSICCVTFNHAEFIHDSLRGFLTQKTTFPVEILIHDDASTDNTADIIKTYERQHPSLINPIYQRENQYSRGARPTVQYNLPRTKGKYIALCEGDDYWIDPLKLQKQVNYLEENPRFAICFHPVKILKNGQFFDDFITGSPPRISTILDLANSNYIHTPSCVFRNRIADISWTHIADCPLGDYYIHMMNARYGDIMQLEDTMAVYRLHDTSTFASRDRAEKNARTLKAIAAIIADLGDQEDGARANLIRQHIRRTLESYDDLVKRSGADTIILLGNEYASLLLEYAADLQRQVRHLQHDQREQTSISSKVRNLAKSITQGMKKKARPLW